MTIGEKIRTERILGGLTQKELGKRMGVDASTIRKYESGRLNPKLETVQKIAQALHIDISVLYGDSGPCGDTGPSISADFLALVAPTAKEIKCQVLISEINSYLMQMNCVGLETAAKRMRELAEIPRYQDPAGRKAAQEQNAQRLDESAGESPRKEIQAAYESYLSHGELPDGYVLPWMRGSEATEQDTSDNTAEETTALPK